MEFRKYCHIENTYSSDLLEKVRMAGLDSPEIVYACFRKIDGSNVQFSIDENGDFYAGSRNQLLDAAGDFQNWQKVVERDSIEKKLRLMKEKLTAKADLGDEILVWLNDHSSFCLTLFGELCGGLYRHPEVERDKEAVRIQGRIDYSPSNQWIPFDLMLSSGNSSILADTDLLAELCKETGLYCQIEEFRGTLDECLNFSPVYIDDTGNRFWGLPLIENNVGEGVVIKPIKPLWLGQARVIFKNKNPKYKERIRATKENNLKNTGLNEKEEYWFNVMKDYMNENRVLTAISKVGCKEFPALLKESTIDAINNFKEENPDFEIDGRRFDPKDFDVHAIFKQFNKFSTETVRKVFLENR